MILKRAATILLISIANLILLAHIIIPHHHHKSEVCLVNTHCENNSNANEFNNHGHEHDGNPKSDYCLLKQLVLLPSQRVASDFNESDFIIDIDNSDLSFLGLISIAPDLSGLATEQCKIPVFFTENYSLLITSGQGLRAPPIA